MFFLRLYCKLQPQPTKFELTSRCNIRLSLDWWSVFYQFCIIAFALFAAFTERMFQVRTVRLPFCCFARDPNTQAGRGIVMPSTNMQLGCRRSATAGNTRIWYAMRRLPQARVRVSLLFGIAIAWVAIQANNYLPNVTTRTNAIRDAEVYEQDVTPTNKDWCEPRLPMSVVMLANVHF